MHDVEFHHRRARAELQASRRAKTEQAALLHLQLSTLHQQQARALRLRSSHDERLAAQNQARSDGRLMRAVAYFRLR